MTHSVWKYLKEPYPFNYEWNTLRWLLPSIFFLGALFLFIFQPFANDWEEHKYPFIVICTIHSLTAVLFLAPFMIFSNLRVRDKNQWTVLKEVTLMFFAFLAVGIGNYLIRDFIYTNTYNNWDLKYLAEEIKNAFAIGLIIYPMIVMGAQVWLKEKYKTASASLSNEIINNASPQEKEIVFKNAAGKEELRLQLHEFLFLKAEGNYLMIFFKKETIAKQMIRNTVSTIAKTYPEFFHPHRSYLVNIDQISRVGGNSQGYTLHFEGLEMVIPVSRNKKAALLKLKNRAL